MATTTARRSMTIPPVFQTFDAHPKDRAACGKSDERTA
jgi:hypothetical protein